MMKMSEDMFSRFDAKAACDRLTDRHTDRHLATAVRAMHSLAR